MTDRDYPAPVTGDLLDEEFELSFVELCRACRLPAERIEMLIAEGVIEPRGRDPRSWRFTGVTLTRIRTVQRLEQDLGVNPSGAALALELIEEITHLRRRVRRLESQEGE